MFKFKTKSEKKAFSIGCRVGARKQKRLCCNKPKSKQYSRKKTTARKVEKPTYLGSTYVNGKFYDTNFKKPVEIKKDVVKRLHAEYDFDGKRTDKEVVDSYVKHMQRKYGHFDKNGKFLGLLGD